MIQMNLLFVCQHGAAKSVIAALHCCRMAEARGLRVTAASAGLEPDADVPDAVRAGLVEDGLDPAGLTPRDVKGVDPAAVDVVITFGCEAPFGGSARRVQWENVPPVSEDYRIARDQIVARLEVLLDSL